MNKKNYMKNNTDYPGYVSSHKTNKFSLFIMFTLIHHYIKHIISCKMLHTNIIGRLNIQKTCASNEGETL